MDHKVSKDMISSGMIPSGEKTQADLSRTQYGSVPSPSKLMDAYKSMYEHHKKDADGNTIPHEGEELNEGKIPAGLQAYLDKKKGKKEDKKEVKEENVDEAAPLAALAPMLTKIAAIGKGAAATVGKAAVKGAIKVGGKTGGSMMKSVVRNPMQTLQKVDMVGRMIPKPSGLPGAQKKKEGDTVSAGSYQAADVDLFDIVKGQLLDEGLSEEDIKDIMLTLTPDEILNELSGDLLKRAAIKAGDERGKLASQGDREGAVKKLDQQKKFSDAMKSKNLEKSRAENMRKPTQYDRPVSRPQPDPTQPYPGTPR